MVSPCPQPPLPEPPCESQRHPEARILLSLLVHVLCSILHRRLGPQHSSAVCWAELPQPSPALPAMALCSLVSIASRGVLHRPSLLLPSTLHPPRSRVSEEKPCALPKHRASCGFITNLHTCDLWLPHAEVGPPALCTEPLCYAVGLGS